MNERASNQDCIRCQEEWEHTGVLEITANSQKFLMAAPLHIINFRKTCLANRVSQNEQLVMGSEYRANAAWEVGADDGANRGANSCE